MDKELDLGAIEERLAKITPGPWKYYRKNDDPLRADDGQGYKGLGTRLISQDWPNNDAVILKDEDGEFIAHAPTDIAALIAEVKELRSRNAIFRKLIEDWEIRPENSGEDDL